MEKYLNYLLINRIKSMTSKIDYDIRYFKVPALYALTLSQVGKVYDRHLGIELVPFISTEDNKKISSFTTKEALAFSRRLQLIEDFDFELVEGLPRDKEGSQEFMFFHVSENMVLRHEGTTHSGFAILTSFFKMKQLESVLTHRVVYGTVDEYDRMLEDLIYRA